MIARTTFAAISILVSLATIALAMFWPQAYWLFVVIVPLVALGLHDMIQRTHTILRIYPVIGHIRFLFESIRPEI